MASEQNSVGMNGNYAATQVQGYGGLEQSYNAHSNTSSSTTDQNNTTGSTGTTTNGSGGNPDIPKDEVGWYFVEQYYTTLSRSPEKLFVSCMRIPKTMTWKRFAGHIGRCTLIAPPAFLQQTISVCFRNRS